MASPFPLILAGAAALLVISSSKKKTKAKKPVVEPEKKEEEKPDENDENLDDKPFPSPSPSPTPTPPSPSPSPAPSPDDDKPYAKPEVGPAAGGSCATPIYSRDPQYLAPDLDISDHALAMPGEAQLYFYMPTSFQKKLYEYMLARFKAQANGQERRTVASVVLRDALKHFNSGCGWEKVISTLSEPEKLVWNGGGWLAIMAQSTAGLSDPSVSKLFKTGSRYTIPRAALGENDPGFLGAANKPGPGRRVEFIATDTKLENAEHVIAEVVKLSGPNGENNLFEVKVVGSFQGHDVTPHLTAKHGFKVGSNAYFSQSGPTGIYRIFSAGMV